MGTLLQAGKLEPVLRDSSLKGISILKSTGHASQHSTTNVKSKSLPRLIM